MIELTELTTDEVAKALKTARKAKKISQEQVSQTNGVSRFVTCNAERNIGSISTKKFIDYVRAIGGKLFFADAQPGDPTFLASEIDRVLAAIKDGQISNGHGISRIRRMVMKYKRGIMTTTPLNQRDKFL